MKNILFLIITILFASCGQKETAKTEETGAVENTSDSLTLTTDQLQLMHIELGNAEKRSFVGSITATGKVTILANDMADISSPLHGTDRKSVV